MILSKAAKSTFAMVVLSVSTVWGCGDSDDGGDGDGDVDSATGGTSGGDGDGDGDGDDNGDGDDVLNPGALAQNCQGESPVAGEACDSGGLVCPGAAAGSTCVCGGFDPSGRGNNDWECFGLGQNDPGGDGDGGDEGDGDAGDAGGPNGN